MDDSYNAIDIIEDRSVIRLESGRDIPYISPETDIRDLSDGTWIIYDGEPICKLGRKKALPEVYVHVEPGYTVGRCRMIVRTGERCKNGVRPGWKVCHKHGAGPPSNPGGISDWGLKSGPGSFISS